MLGSVERRAAAVEWVGELDGKLTGVQRLALSPPWRGPRPQLLNRAAVERFLRPYFKPLFPQERFYVVPLGSDLRPRGMIELALGTVDEVAIDGRLMLGSVLASGGVAFLLAHGHPDGLTRPSSEDVRLTYWIRGVADLLGIECVDHLIFGEGRPYSFAADGWSALKPWARRRRRRK